MTMPMRVPILALTAGLILAACGKEKLPSRDEIPILRNCVFQLQQAVLQRSPEAVDSLTSAKALDAGLSADSLLKFVYGPTGDFPFLQFGNYSIFYNDNIAVVSCTISDSAEQVNRPIKLTFRKVDKVWLLKSFRAIDSGTSSP
jgi:hypothetical protein